MPPIFTAPADAYEVDERANSTIDSTDFFSDHTSLAFDAGYTAPSWITISGLNVVITSAPSVTGDTEYTVELTATNADGDVDGEITVSVQQIDPAPVIGTLTRIDINEGESDTIDLSGDLQNTDDLVITSGESWVSVSGLSLVITDAPDVTIDTDYTINLRAESDATREIDTGSVVIRVADVPLPTVVTTFGDASLLLGASTTVTMTWSEDVDGFTATDVSVDVGSLTNFAGSDDVYTATLTAPTTGMGIITLSIIANAVSAGNVLTSATLPYSDTPVALDVSLHNAILFKYPANYNEANDRVTVRGATTVVSEVVDNDYTTYSAEDDVDVNIADANGSPTRVDAIFIKSSWGLAHTEAIQQAVPAPVGRHGRFPARSITSQALRLKRRSTASNTICSYSIRHSPRHR